MVEKGRIHSFETFGTVDGPGIRFVVFMQGCPLSCHYCHNRDTWSFSAGREYTVEQVMSEIRKYKSYMDFSGGGVTLSGGEPAYQAGFTGSLLRKCKEEGFHTALDTSGSVDLERVTGLLDYTDLVLLDIKHADEEMHRKITGASFEKTRSFAIYTSERKIPLWIRYVLVPGLTNHPEDLSKAALFIKSLDNVENIEVLPYHTMGICKWEELGLAYPLQGVEPPSQEEADKALSILKGK